MLVDILVCTDREGLCGKMETKWDDRNPTKYLVHQPWNLLLLIGVSLMVRLDGQEEIGSFVVAIVFFFFSLSHFFQPVCFVFLCICVKHENDMCVSKYVQESSAKPSSC